jgi:hypothetical protein
MPILAAGSSSKGLLGPGRGVLVASEHSSLIVLEILPCFYSAFQKVNWIMSPMTSSNICN